MAHIFLDSIHSLHCESNLLLIHKSSFQLNFVPFLLCYFEATSCCGNKVGACDITVSS